MNYFEIDAISNSDLSLFKKSPAHYRYFKDNPLPPSPSQEFGSALHMFILEPNVFQNEYWVYYPEDRPDKSKTMAANENKNWLQSLKEENKGKIMLTDGQMKCILEMDYAISKNEFASELLTNITMKEQPMVFKINGVKCKSKYDGLNDKSHIIDIKTTTDASQDAFEYAIKKYEYYRQEAFYTYTWGNLPFYFIAIEKEPPYGCAVYSLDDDYRQYGRAEVESLVAQLHQCKLNNTWPGYEYHQILNYTTISKPKYLIS